MIGAQVGIAGHLSIAEGVKIAGQSGVARSISEPGITVQGTPAFKISDFQRSYVVFKKLPSSICKFVFIFAINNLFFFDKLSDSVVAK